MLDCIRELEDYLFYSSCSARSAVVAKLKMRLSGHLTNVRLLFTPELPAKRAQSLYGRTPRAINIR